MDINSIQKKFSGFSKILAKNTNQWEPRAESLAEIEDIVTKFGASNPELKKELGLLITINLTIPFQSQLTDLRSEIVRIACSAVIACARTVTTHFSRCADRVCPTLLSQIGSGNVVIKNYCEQCMRNILPHIRSKRVWQDLRDTSKTSKNKTIQTSAVEFLVIILETWSTTDIAPYMAEIEEMISKSLSGASTETRQFASKAFWEFVNHFERRKAPFLKGLDSRTLKLVQGCQENCSPRNDSKHKAATINFRRLGSSNSDDHKISIGDRIVVERAQGAVSHGVVRYMGKLKLKEGEFVGVVLDTADGKNNGTVQGTVYFTAKDNHGLFTRPDQCRLEDDYFKQHPEKRPVHHSPSHTKSLQPSRVVSRNIPSTNTNTSPKITRPRFHQPVTKVTSKIPSRTTSSLGGGLGPGPQSLVRHKTFSQTLPVRSRANTITLNKSIATPSRIPAPRASVELDLATTNIVPIKQGNLATPRRIRAIPFDEPEKRRSEPVDDINIDDQLMSSTEELAKTLPKSLGPIRSTHSNNSPSPVKLDINLPQRPKPRTDITPIRDTLPNNIQYELPNSSPIKTENVSKPNDIDSVFKLDDDIVKLSDDKEKETSNECENEKMLEEKIENSSFVPRTAIIELADAFKEHSSLIKELYDKELNYINSLLSKQNTNGEIDCMEELIRILTKQAELSSKLARRTLLEKSTLTRQ